jgi:hypothetical protein
MDEEKQLSAYHSIQHRRRNKKEISSSGILQREDYTCFSC